MTISIVLDSETTGLDPAVDRIIEISVHMFDGKKPLGSFTKHINPEGKAIDPKAEMVHGISMSMLRDKPAFKEIAPKLFKVICAAQNIVGHNLEFDMGFLIAEFSRLRYDLTTWQHKKAFCTMENGRWATATGKVPTLKELCFATGIEYNDEKAHGAFYDTQVTAKALFKGVELGFFDLEL